MPRVLQIHGRGCWQITKIVVFHFFEGDILNWILLLTNVKTLLVVLESSLLWSFRLKYIYYVYLKNCFLLAKASP
jgi:hypothetical protein